MLDVVCGILSGAGIARTDVPPGTNGVWLYLIDVEKLMSREQYAAVIEAVRELHQKQPQDSRRRRNPDAG